MPNKGRGWMAAGMLAAMLLVGAVRSASAGGLAVCEVGVSSPTVVNCTSSPSTLWAVIVDSVAVNADWVIVFDSNTISGYTQGTIQDGTLAAPRVAQINGATAATTNYPESNAGGLPPRNIKNGLTVVKKSAGDVIRILYTTP